MWRNDEGMKISNDGMRHISIRANSFRCLWNVPSLIRFTIIHFLYNSLPIFVPPILLFVTHPLSHPNLAGFLFRCVALPLWPETYDNFYGIPKSTDGLCRTRARPSILQYYSWSIFRLESAGKNICKGTQWQRMCSAIYLLSDASKLPKPWRSISNSQIYNSPRIMSEHSGVECSGV